MRRPRRWPPGAGPAHSCSFSATTPPGRGKHLDTAGLPAVFAPRGEAAADLALMQRCQGFILSNSTYSWWAQYLADAPDKQVWAPDRWYAHTKRSDLYLPGWQRIAVQ